MSYAGTTLFSSIAQITTPAYSNPWLVKLLDDAECLKHIESLLRTEPTGEVHIYTVNGVPIGYIFGEVADFNTLSDWVAEFEFSMDAIARDLANDVDDYLWLVELKNQV